MGMSARIVLQRQKRKDLRHTWVCRQKVTFLGQLQLKLAVGIRQLPVIAHQVMKQVGACVVHALQKV
jgi:hypothetical protein